MSNRHIYFINVNPRLIVNISLLPERSPSLIGEEAWHGKCHGLWDLLKVPFENYFLYGTVTSILKGHELKQSPLFKKVENGRITEDEAMIQFNKLKRQIEKLRMEGYLSQYELGKMDELIYLGRYLVPSHETIVGLGRSGKLMRLVGGRHRLAIAQQIGLTSMPAILSLVHSSMSGDLPEKRRILTGSIDDFRPF